MAKTNVKKKPSVATRRKARYIDESNVQLTTTHEGAIARVDTPELELRRAVVGCMLWEDQFYESGKEIATRITELASKLNPQFVADLAVEARKDFGIRHAPLLLLTVLAKTGAGIPHLVQDTVYNVISRADELSELLAIYWKDGKKPLPNQFKKGLARAINKFDAYQLSKYNRDSSVQLRDVVFLTHPVAGQDVEKGQVLAKLVNKDFFPKKTKGGFNVSRVYSLQDFKKLEAPDTWEVNLSAGKDKKETFTRMLQEGKLGYLALLRNLRNMVKAGVDRKLIKDAIVARKGARNVFPFRFIAAARHCPSMADALDQAFLAHTKDIKKLKGTTVVVVDVSGSMYGGQISKGSDMTRMDGAAALAAILRECGEDVRVFATATTTAEVPATRGIGLATKVTDMAPKLGGGGIYFRKAMDYVSKKTGHVDRVIVVTDEQDCETGYGFGKGPLNAQAFGDYNYIINVSSYSQAITYDDWTRISGFSENIVNYLVAMENNVQVG